MASEALGDEQKNRAEMPVFLLLVALLVERNFSRFITIRS